MRGFVRVGPPIEDGDKPRNPGNRFPLMHGSENLNGQVASIISEVNSYHLWRKVSNPGVQLTIEFTHIKSIPMEQIVYRPTLLVVARIRLGNSE